MLAAPRRFAPPPSAFRELGVERLALERLSIERSPIESTKSSPRRRTSAVAPTNRPEREVPKGSLMPSDRVQSLGAATSNDVVIAHQSRSAEASSFATATARSSVAVGALPSSAFPAASDSSIEVSRKPRMAGGFFPQPPWAGGHDEKPPELWPEKGERPVWFGEAVYGRYFGPWSTSTGRPISPVDLSAYYHDIEYGQIQSHYTRLGEDASNFDLWVEPWYRVDEPQFIYDVAMADLRMNEQSFSFMARGLDEGLYRDNPGLLLSDMAAATGAYIVNTYLAAHRVAVYAGFSILDSFGEFFSGDITFGGLIERLAKAGANVIAAAAYWVAGTVRGVGSFLVSSVKAVLQNPGKALGGAAAGAGIGFIIGGPVGAVVGGIIGGIVGGGGCFLTTAVCKSTGLSDDNEVVDLLRHYRDNYLARRPGGLAEIAKYYEIAPVIVHEIEKRPDADRVWRRAYEDFIMPAVAAIRTGRMESAYAIYQKLFERMLIVSGLRAVSFNPKIDSDLIGVGKPL